MLNTNLTYVGPEMDKVNWRVNLSSIYNHAKSIFGYVKLGEYNKDVVVLIGEKSFQFPIEVYRTIFPHITSDNIKIVKNAGNPS